jgi:hypothetical protein
MSDLGLIRPDGSKVSTAGDPWTATVQFWPTTGRVTVESSQGSAGEVLHILNRGRIEVEALMLGVRIGGRTVKGVT